MQPSRNDLEVATTAMRGIMRYHNQDTVRVIAMLISGVDRATSILEADVHTLKAMVLVDPEFEPLFNERLMEKKKTLADLRHMASLVRTATQRARADLNPEQGDQ